MFSNLFIACSNTQSDEELQMIINNQENRADDTGGQENPPVKPPSN